MAITKRLKKRNGEIADFQPKNITIAIQKAFAAVMGDANEPMAEEVTRVVVDAIDLKFGNTAFFPLLKTSRTL